MLAIKNYLFSKSFACSCSSYRLDVVAWGQRKIVNLKNLNKLKLDDKNLLTELDSSTFPNIKECEIEMTDFEYRF